MGLKGKDRSRLVLNDYVIKLYTYTNVPLYEKETDQNKKLKSE